MMITLKDIKIQASGHTFFNGANWSIEAGEAWAILGPTGAGKSLLAQVMARRWSLTRGQITYYFDPVTTPEGRSYLHPGEILIFSAETHGAFVEHYASYYQARWQSLEGEENPTAGDYLTAIRKRSLARAGPNPLQPIPGPFPLAGQSGRPDDLHDGLNSLLFESLAIEPIFHRQVHQLSNGESRKVFLAGLLLASPNVLILDDPYTGLDAASRAALATTVETLIAHGEPQVLFFTSHPEDVPASIGRILDVRDGHILFTGPRAGGMAPAALAALFGSNDPTIAIQSIGSSYKSTPPALASAAASYADDLVQNTAFYSAVVVEMQNVTVTYGDNRILDAIHWQVRQGERWLLSGPNGAGKSTLLSLVMGDNPQAYANPISLFGQRRGTGDSIWEIKRAIGYVSPELQAFYAHPSLDRPPFTCLQVAISGFFDSVGLYRRPTHEQKKTAYSWLEAFDLLEQVNYPFTSLSNGQKRLTLLARALVKHPPLLVLDEPCQALDADHRQTFTTLIDSLCASTPLTLIYVTHDPAEAPTAITHHLELDHGRVVENNAVRRL